MTRLGTNVGWNTTPYVYVSAISGVRVGLPPIDVLICAAGFARMCPNSAAVTPVFWQNAKVWPLTVPPTAAPQHGSAVPPAPTTAGENRSPMLGARTARLKPARRRASWTGAHATPILHVL